MQINPVNERNLKVYTEIAKRAFAEEPWEQKWDDETLEKRYLGFLSDPQGVGYEVVEDGKVVGAMFGGQTQLVDTILYTIHSIFVDPEYQRKGYGSKLLEYAEEALYRQGVGVIHLDTMRSEKTMEFYKKNGYSDSSAAARLRKELEFDVLMRKIEQGLSGQYELDMAYLDKAKEQSQDLKYGVEMGHEIDRLKGEKYPEEQEKLDAVERAMSEEAYAVIEQVKDDIKAGNYEAVVGKCEAAIEKFNPYFERNGFQEYFCFNNLLEVLIYLKYTDYEKEFTHSFIPFDSLYFWAGYAYFEMGQYEEAEEMMWYAQAWNPIDCDVLFEYAETLKIQNKWDEFQDVVRKALAFAYIREDIAKAYRYLAFYYCEENKWEVAHYCCVLSGSYHDDPHLEEEMGYIREGADTEFDEPTLVRSLGIARENQIPLGPSRYVLGSLSELMEDGMRDDNWDGVKRYASALYDLTENEEYEFIVDHCDDYKADELDVDGLDINELDEADILTEDDALVDILKDENLVGKEDGDGTMV